MHKGVLEDDWRKEAQRLAAGSRDLRYKEERERGEVEIRVISRRSRRAETDG
jgi:hypothetical protein